MTRCRVKEELADLSEAQDMLEEQVRAVSEGDPQFRDRAIDQMFDDSHFAEFLYERYPEAMAVCAVVGARRAGLIKRFELSMESEILIAKCIKEWLTERTEKLRDEWVDEQVQGRMR